MSLHVTIATVAGCLYRAAGAQPAKQVDYKVAVWPCDGAC